MSALPRLRPQTDRVWGLEGFIGFRVYRVTGRLPQVLKRPVHDNFGEYLERAAGPFQLAVAAAVRPQPH